jgi:hypothetical protein
VRAIPDRKKGKILPEIKAIKKTGLFIFLLSVVFRNWRLKINIANDWKIRAISKPKKEIHLVSPLKVRHLPNSEKKLLKKLYPFV